MTDKFKVHSNSFWWFDDGQFELVMSKDADLSLWLYFCLSVEFYDGPIVFGVRASDCSWCFADDKS